MSVAKLDKNSKLVNGLSVNMESHMNKINFILRFFYLFFRQLAGCVVVLRINY